MRILFVFVFLLGLVSCGEKNGEYKSCQVYHSYKKWDWRADGTKDGFYSDVLKKYKNDTICSLLNYKNNKLISRKVFANGKLIIEQKAPVSKDLLQIARSDVGAIVSGDFHHPYYGYCLEFNKNGDTIGMYEINDSITQLKKIWSEKDDYKLIIKFHKRKDIYCIKSTGYKETVIFTKNHFNKYGTKYLYRAYDENGKIDPKRSGEKDDKNYKWRGKYIEPYDKWTLKKLNINPNNWNKHGK